MSNAAARVLELFLQTPKRGVTGVTYVAASSVTSKSPAVTMVTPVTYEKQQIGESCVTDERAGEFATPDELGINFEERAAIVQYDGGVPRAWAEGFAWLDPQKPPHDVPPRRWLCFIDDCGRFLDDGWAARAAELGWGPLDLFGCDRERPFARVDQQGLLWLVKGGSIVELHRDRAILRTERGATQTYRRRPVEVGRVVLAWEVRS
jgi:hypothetical protein